MKKRLAFTAILIAVLLSAFSPLFSASVGFDPFTLPTASAAPGFFSPAIQKVWLKTDQLVDVGAVKRSYLWGPTRISDGYERYYDSPNQVRHVQYFDKSRMELNNPFADPNGGAYVTNGLLVKELISGQRQDSDTRFIQLTPADNVPVAGDPIQSNPNSPTYASFRNIASLDLTSIAAQKKPSAVGSLVTATIDKAGTIGSNVSLGNTPGAQIAYWDSNLGHNIPKALWDYMNQNGPVLGADNTTTINGGKVFDWIYAMGLPITEAYWTRAVVAGVEKDVLVQAFERRVLTFTPSNSAAYQVEMGNVGAHYFRWRYPNGNIGTPAPNSPLKVPSLGYGINAHLFYVDHTQVTGWVNDLGMRWVRQQITWKDIEGADTQSDPSRWNWAELDTIVNTLYANNTHIMLSPVGAPSFYSPNGGIPTDPNTFGRFINEVAKRYKGKVEAYEIWNEQNLASEAGKPISVAKYVTLAQKAYSSIKSADQYAFVVLGALSPTGVNDVNAAIDDVKYLQQLYAFNSGEIKNYYDVLGAHPGSNLNPPDTMWPSNPGPGPGWVDNASFYFRRIEQLRQVMVDNGEASKQMWLTEFGWYSTPNPAAGYEYGRYITEDLQAQYISRAYQKAAQEYPWMGVMMLWNLNFSQANVTADAGNEKVGWAILRRDGSKRPAYTAVQTLARAVK
ncbi:MAG: cellulase family glycosylhydrolase [Chloroflexota bacterium]|nr:cellulase family glycosylhydrolase [Chloroflexota bacterium]